MQGVRIKLESSFSRAGGVWTVGGEGDNERKSRPMDDGAGGLLGEYM